MSFKTSKWLVALWLVVSTAYAKPVHVVEVASFDCSGSLGMNAAHNQIRSMVEATGGSFTFAPMPPSAKFFTREALYYASREMGIEDQVREAFFSAQKEQVFLRNRVEAMEWLKFKGIEDEQVEELLSRARADFSALGRAAKLVDDAGVTQTPTYLVVSESGVRALALPEETSERLQRLIELIRMESSK